MRLYSLPCDKPFDVVFLNLVWSPGKVPDAAGNYKVLTIINCMTGFTIAAYLGKFIDSSVVATAVFANSFMAVGLPWLIFVDGEGIFKAVFRELFKLLHIPVEAVSTKPFAMNDLIAT